MWKNNIYEGAVVNAWVNYDSVTKNLSVFVSDAQNPVFRGIYSFSYTVDLSDVLPEWARIGFSASTGKLTDFTTRFSFVAKDVKDQPFFVAPVESEIPPKAVGGYLALFSPETALNASKANQIVAAGLRPDTFTYTSLILGHCRNKDVNSAYNVFKMMPKKGCRRNEVSYANLIHGLCEARRVDEGVSLFKKMKEDDCYPTVRTYTVIIDALFGNDRKLEAIDLFNEMRNRGCEPNVHTYTVMIDSMSKERKFDESRRLLNDDGERVGSKCGYLQCFD
ncbi:hypothetical protein GH714_042337 [Hevea brasiliensis]|uniref:Legume lectin domain-containing protein n=1 Tax=Hevea brasiliensis TaxID=3981 RepID=A0A6A6KA80_HEVBR|nr:hypothetical protein GH714_042337 [Hevea brasiliensis]